MDELLAYCTAQMLELLEEIPKVQAKPTTLETLGYADQLIGMTQGLMLVVAWIQKETG